MAKVKSKKVVTGKPVKELKPGKTEKLPEGKSAIKVELKKAKKANDMAKVRLLRTRLMAI